MTDKSESDNIRDVITTKSFDYQNQNVELPRLVFEVRRLLHEHETMCIHLEVSAETSTIAAEKMYWMLQCATTSEVTMGKQQSPQPPGVG